jgi:hypothetical protein
MLLETKKKNYTLAGSGKILPFTFYLECKLTTKPLNENCLRTRIFFFFVFLVSFVFVTIDFNQDNLVF